VNVPFGDLRRELDEQGPSIRAAIGSVVDSGRFVLGTNLHAFESEFADYLGEDSHVVGVGSGTEAIHLALVAAGVEAGDYVVTVPNTAVPTVSAISAAGATPLLVDVSEASFTMDPEKLRELVAAEKQRLGARLKAVVPVHLYGQSADMDPIVAVAREFDLAVIEDACQAHGAEYRGRKAGTLGDFAAFSFYPSKNLGCYGDGGAVVARDSAGAERLKMLRNYGETRRYVHEIKGFNSRLDEVQAAVLSAKLPHLGASNERRTAIAAIYARLIHPEAVATPTAQPWGRHAWHLYVVRYAERDGLMARLGQAGVGTLIHYPIPIHLQKAYADLGVAKGALPVAESLAGEILSLPMFPQLTDAEVEFVASSVNSLV
jgi:dTDP-4-amino-4,6-dideoxygalactose transaminase